MPSGGSLTADQWLLLATVYGLIVVCDSVLFKTLHRHHLQTLGAPALGLLLIGAWW